MLTARLPGCVPRMLRPPRAGRGAFPRGVNRATLGASISLHPSRSNARFLRRVLGRASVPQPPSTQILIQSPSGFARFAHWLGWLGFAVCGALLLRMAAARSEYLDTAHGVQERFFFGDPQAEDKIAVIRLSGVILDGDGFARDQIERVRADDRVKAVVLRINSPGGTVAGSDYLFHHLTRLREEKKIPLVVSMGAIAASGGYYAAMAVGDQPDTIFAEPTCNTGSIGVVIPHYDISGLLERLGVVDDSIATHPRKLMLSMTRPLDDDQRQLAESYVQESLVRFLEVVKQGRPKLTQEAGALLADGRNLATGEVFLAPDALKYGLVDRLGFVEDAAARAMELAGLNKDTTRIVEYTRVASLLDWNGLTGGAAPPWRDGCGSGQRPAAIICARLIRRRSACYSHSPLPCCSKLWLISPTAPFVTRARSVSFGVALVSH